MATAESVEIVNRRQSFRGVTLGEKGKSFAVELLGVGDPAGEAKTRVKVPPAFVAEAIKRREELLGIGLEVVRV